MYEEKTAKANRQTLFGRASSQSWLGLIVYPRTLFKSMNYLDEVVKALRHILDSDEPDAEKWADEIVAFVREKLLESYKNGAQAARRGRPNQYKKSKTRK